MRPEPEVQTFYDNNSPPEVSAAESSTNVKDFASDTAIPPSNSLLRRIKIMSAIAILVLIAIALVIGLSLGLARRERRLIRLGGSG